MSKGGGPHGKFIILSFNDDEEAIFANTVTALASVADLSTVAASADAPLLFGSLQADSFDASWTGISSMVYKLRRKLGTGIIETVRGHGYKFVAPGTSPK